MCQSKANEQYVADKLGLPVDWIAASEGLCLQNFNCYELAIEKWLQAGNLQQAHRIWHEKILPLYMHRSPNVSMVKALHLSDKVTASERQSLFREQRICPREPKVDVQVERFFQASAQISDWNTKTGNFRNFILLLRDLSEIGFSTGEACRNFQGRVRSIQKYSRDDPDDPVDHFIGQEIATISNFLQMKEDEANILEGRQKNAGVVLYTGSNSFKFESDGRFVAQNRPRVFREGEQLV